MVNDLLDWRGSLLMGALGLLVTFHIVVVVEAEGVVSVVMNDFLGHADYREICHLLTALFHSTLMVGWRCIAHVAICCLA